MKNIMFVKKIKGNIFKFSTMIASYNNDVWAYNNDIWTFLILNIFTKYFKNFKRIIFMFQIIPMYIWKKIIYNYEPISLPTIWLLVFTEPKRSMLKSLRGYVCRDNIFWVETTLDLFFFDANYTKKLKREIDNNTSVFILVQCAHPLSTPNPISNMKS